MTQPQVAPAEQSDAGAIIAVAAIGLALVAIEARVRQEVEDAIAAAATAIGVALAAILAAPPVTLIGITLIADPRVYAALTGKLAAARRRSKEAVASGYHGAAAVALARSRRDFADDNIELPELPDTLTRLDADLDTMFRHAEGDIANSVRLAFDGVQGDDAAVVRPVVVDQALQQAAARLQRRAAASAGVAVHRAASDAQQAIWLQQQMNADTVYRKRWVAASAQPCGMCRALHGSIVALDAEFDHNAASDDRDWRPVWRGLQGPPRHPDCRCQLELVRS